MWMDLWRRKQGVRNTSQLNRRLRKLQKDQSRPMASLNFRNMKNKLSKHDNTFDRRSKWQQFIYHEMAKAVTLLALPVLPLLPQKVSTPTNPHPISAFSSLWIVKIRSYTLTIALKLTTRRICGVHVSSCTSTPTLQLNALSHLNKLYYNQNTGLYLPFRFQQSYKSWKRMWNRCCTQISRQPLPAAFLRPFASTLQPCTQKSTSNIVFLAVLQIICS